VGFRQSSYQVVEGQTVEVCVDMMEGIIGNGVTIPLTHHLTPPSGRVLGILKLYWERIFLKLQDLD